MRILILLCLIIYSCNTDAVPKGVFTPKKMEAILYDVIRADELVDFSSMSDSTYRQFSKRSALYDSIFILHSITKEEYKKSMEYYQGRPDLLKNILDALHARTDTTGLKKDSVMKKPVIKEVIKPQ